ncbi:MAG: hypothetical protein ACOYZ8_00800 [Chloroflexota bacterium]
MTKWEYKTIVRERGWDKDKTTPKAAWSAATNWNVDIDKTLKELGEEGWELVAVTSRSNYLGGFREGSNWVNYMGDYAGFTSHETWVFKRPK